MKLSDLTLGQKCLLEESLKMLIQLAHANAKDHGFWDEFAKSSHALACYDEVGEPNLGSSLQEKYLLDTKLHKIALMHSELGEATEGVRKPHADEHCAAFTSEEVELADTIIRIFDYAGAFGLRLEEALLEKMFYNEGRPYKHGKGA